VKPPALSLRRSERRSLIAALKRNPATPKASPVRQGWFSEGCRLIDLIIRCLSRQDSVYKIAMLIVGLALVHFDRMTRPLAAVPAEGLDQLRHSRLVGRQYIAAFKDEIGLVVLAVSHLHDDLANGTVADVVKLVEYRLCVFSH